MDRFMSLYKKLKKDIENSREKNPEDFMKIIFEGINLVALEEGDKEALKKLRQNIYKLINEVLLEKKKPLRERLLKGVKSAFFKALTEWPIITPVITGMLQVITSEDVNERLDLIITLDRQLIDLQKQTIDLQKQTIDLQKQTIDLQKQTIDLQKQNLEKSDKIIKILDERLPPSSPLPK